MLTVPMSSAHRVDGRAVAAVLVAAADPAPGRHRGRLGHPDQLQGEVAVGCLDASRRARAAGYASVRGRSWRRTLLPGRPHAHAGPPAAPRWPSPSPTPDRRRPAPSSAAAAAVTSASTGGVLATRTRTRPPSDVVSSTGPTSTVRGLPVGAARCRATAAGSASAERRGAGGQRLGGGDVPAAVDREAGRVGGPAPGVLPEQAGDPGRARRRGDLGGRVRPGPPRRPRARRSGRRARPRRPGRG